jgi:hypothetical protein
MVLGLLLALDPNVGKYQASIASTLLKLNGSASVGETIPTLS